LFSLSDRGYTWSRRPMNRWRAVFYFSGWRSRQHC